MKKVRHVLGISGGKDSAALAIYMKTNYPELNIEYYTTDTGKELEETYELIDNLEVFLGKKIIRLTASLDEENHGYDSFDYLLNMKFQFLPSTQARWCTQSLKLAPFEKFVGDDPVVSYVGIRGDENREGYISKKLNIQSIFPFRKNIWSEDVINKVFLNKNIPLLLTKCENTKEYSELLAQPVSQRYTLKKKVEVLMDFDLLKTNAIIFDFVKSSSYPLSNTTEFSLVNNTDVLIKEDIFRILRESGVGVPRYYEKVSFEVNGKRGEYSRSRSGCYFCFFQQKIEWVWLYEQHPDLFMKALNYEKKGYAWNDNETLTELTMPKRIEQIKEDYLKKQNNRSEQGKISSKLIDILSEDDENEIGCAACFI
ncbi:phosphoadenosine phosphosulfate reductase family protein [Dyadobacter sp. CY107]|uniref:phosphoadenosine phosphosulfate reductase domain-containing protein n=1 Tax=Dyadobacter fanqingshengii TaxID=2906443 RepID=UPI001F489379|nr:phosphoadenosine phosphosulfate reductase family protein [Dyadobacter fanqingshengii]MCF2503763.1 phosphoadenosine phosphosulfate reductase family protein [Dyadobacter fanqingshengii]